MRRQASIPCLILVSILKAVPATAFSNGITTLSFGVSGCNQCHSGGTIPVVNLSGPTDMTENLDSLIDRKDFIRGDLEDIVHLDWSSTWRP